VRLQSIFYLFLRGTLLFLFEFELQLLDKKDVNQIHQPYL